MCIKAQHICNTVAALDVIAQRRFYIFLQKIHINLIIIPDKCLSWICKWLLHIDQQVVRVMLTESKCYSLR